MGTWLSDDSAKALADAYKNADMHAGNQRPKEVADQEQKYAAEKEAIKSIDWEAHRRFMRGM